MDYLENVLRMQNEIGGLPGLTDHPRLQKYGVGRGMKEEAATTLLAAFSEVRQAARRMEGRLENEEREGAAPAAPSVSASGGSRTGNASDAPKAAGYAAAFGTFGAPSAEKEVWTPEALSRYFERDARRYG